MKSRKTATLSLGIAGILASAMLTGCTPSGEVIDADYAKACQDKRSEIRVDDNNCSDAGRSGGYYGWYFYPTGGGTVPPVGSKMTGGSTTAPAAGKSVAPAPAKGGTVARGGFGGSAKGGSIGG